MNLEMSPGWYLDHAKSALLRKTCMASGPRRALTWMERWIDMLMDQDIEGLMCGWNGLNVMEPEWHLAQGVP